MTDTVKTFFLMQFVAMQSTWILVAYLTKVVFKIDFLSPRHNIFIFIFFYFFNSGLSFEWPEQVPFRLTHNMIEAMGATGIEGSFRKCCEVTLRVLRQEIDTLLSVLKPFVHDPLVEWSKKTVNKGRSDLPEIKNEQV